MDGGQGLARCRSLATDLAALEHCNQRPAEPHCATGHDLATNCKNGRTQAGGRRI